jgi:hypothetical protein|tara:strand:- start:462 stop:662 length:201 start_codon:yes stop_codon:yes gene_type:complete
MKMCVLQVVEACTDISAPELKQTNRPAPENCGQSKESQRDGVSRNAFFKEIINRLNGNFANYFKHK